mmetsp:Transcript_62856/g.99744  ORF Transcript_62856/g.99744 Transcript_62856/m.99744 type:complete len:852 (-) Transcript_62856:129-2684(-)
MPGACVHSKPVSFWLGDDFEAACPLRSKIGTSSKISGPNTSECRQSGLPIGCLTRKQVSSTSLAERLHYPWKSIGCGRLLVRAQLPLLRNLQTDGFSDSTSSSQTVVGDELEVDQEPLDLLAGYIKLKTALESLGGLASAYLLRQVFVKQSPKRRALLIAACLLLLQGETACLQQCALPLEWFSPALPAIAEGGVRQDMAALLRLVQVSGCASLVFASLAPSHPAITMIALACLNASRCLEQRSLGVLFGTDFSPAAAGVHWPFLGACVGGGLLHLGTSPEVLLPLTTVPGVLVVLWASVLEREMKAESEGSPQQELQLQMPMPCLPAVRKSLGIAEAIPVLWEVFLPLGVWGPWLSNADFQTSMLAFAAPLLPFEAAVTICSGSSTKATYESTPNRSGTSIISLQLLRIVGVAHVVWFHQLHEGSIIERLSCPIHSSSFLCHVGEAGMYWVGFFFMLSGFVNAYQNFGRKGMNADTCDSNTSFAWRRIVAVYPQYLCAVVVGVIGAMAAAQGVQAFALQPGNLIGILKALTFSNVIVYPYSYGGLPGLSHLWYMCSLVIFWFRFDDWAAFLQKLPRQSSWMVLLYCWMSTLAMPAVDYFGWLVPGSILQQVFSTPRYFAFYHPVNNWMFFAGGVALARLLQPSQVDAIHDGRVQRAIDWAASRLGASVALAAVFVVIPLVDWASPSNILFRSVHGYISFPGFAAVIFAAIREKDLLLSLPSRLGLDRWLQVLGEMSGPCFLLHKPLHEVQWNFLPLVHSKLAILANVEHSVVARYALVAAEWTYAHGLFVHWGLVLGGGAAAYSLLPARSHTLKALPPAKEAPLQVSPSSDRWVKIIQNMMTLGGSPLRP